jgi:hypothetical protein
MIQRTLRTGFEFYERESLSGSPKINMFTSESVLITGSRSCENLRSICNPVLKLKKSVDSHCENLVENRVSIGEPPNNGLNNHCKD